MRASGRKFYIGLLSSAIFVVLASYQADWDKTLATLRDADWALAALGIGAALGTLVIFAFRWRVLLSRTAEIPVNNTFSYMMIGYLANIVLPLRLGEVAKAVLLGRKHGIKTSVIFGSVVLERTLDVLTVLMLALGVSFLMQIPPAFRAGIISFAVTGIAVLLVLLCLARKETGVLAWLTRLSAFAPAFLGQWLTAGIGRFTEGLGALRDGRVLGSVLCLSMLAWLTAGGATTCYIAAFHLQVPWYAGFFVLTVTNLGAAIPSSPGFVGVYHYLAVLALSIWVPDRSQALGFAIGTHGINVLSQVLIGVTCLAREGIALKSFSAMGAVVQERNALPKTSLRAAGDRNG